MSLLTAGPKIAVLCLFCLSGKPEILQEPVDTTTGLGGFAVFSIKARGKPFDCQWFHNGKPMTGG